jgi:hypothetical protein
MHPMVLQMETDFFQSEMIIKIDFSVYQLRIPIGSQVLKTYRIELFINP